MRYNEIDSHDVFVQVVNTLNIENKLDVYINKDNYKDNMDILDNAFSDNEKKRILNK